MIIDFHFFKRDFDNMIWDSFCFMEQINRTLTNRTIANLQSVGNLKKQDVGHELLNYFFPQIDHEQ